MYTTVPIPIYIDIAKLIGRGGRNLKHIIDCSGCWYMWVDSRQKIVEIWGREEHIASGIAAIKHKMRKNTNVWTPIESIGAKVSVTCWESGHRTFYNIDGHDNDIKVFFDNLCKRYPFNPYMTQIEKRTMTGLLVARFSSCD